MSIVNRRQATLGLLLGAALGPAGQAYASQRTPILDGAVAAPDAYGAQVGADILKGGGNAVDAAIGVAFALAVTYPEAGNIGGGGFMTILMNRRSYFLDYRETAPAAASTAMYLDSSGQVMANKSLVGNQAVGIPGTVKGMAAAHRRFGKLPWTRLLAPAIKLAKEGFLPLPQMIKIYKESEALLGKDTNIAAYFGGLKADEVFVQNELAQTLERISALGAAGFYSGQTADLIVAQMGRGTDKGLLSHRDLLDYRPVWRQALCAKWNGYDVITAPPPSSGGIALLQMLSMKNARPDLFEDVEHNSAQYVHLLAELEKRAYADRAEYLGDPGFVKVPVKALLDPSYLANRAAQLSPHLPSSLSAVPAGLERPQTTHFSIVDSQGNAVANTYTLNGWYGSGVVVEGGGFLLNNEMDDFSAKAGTANQYGLVGGDANAILPGKRPLSSMTPTIIARNGQPVLVLGSPGGSRIITTVMQVTLNALAFSMPLKTAINAPRYHHQLLPENTIFTEPYAAADPIVKAELERRGYRFEAQDFNGDVAAIQITNGETLVAPDPRARGAAVLVQRG